jgi:hypothetical protein
MSGGAKRSRSQGSGPKHKDDFKCREGSWNANAKMKREEREEETRMEMGGRSGLDCGDGPSVTKLSS